MNDYIELGPDDVICEGDEFWAINKEVEKHSRCTNLVGSQIKPEWLTQGYRFRRPRSTLIRDAAFAVLKHIYDPRFADFDGFSSENEEDMYPVFVELRKALGVTVEELRKA